MEKRKINQKDIAESLNLSVATVSKALRGDYGDINSETRERVVNRASQLGYDLGSRKQQAIEDEEETKSYMVGVLILRKLHEWQHTNYFAGMTEKCSRLNVSLIMHYVSEDNCHLILDKENQPPAMRDGNLSGLILVNQWPEDIVAKLPPHVPCVSIQQPYHKARMDIIGVDEAMGIEQLMHHLYALGHRKIGFLGRCGKVYHARVRFAAYVSSLAQFGLELDLANVIDVTPGHLEDKEITLAGQIESVRDRKSVV